MKINQYKKYLKHIKHKTQKQSDHKYRELQTYYRYPREIGHSNDLGVRRRGIGEKAFSVNALSIFVRRTVYIFQQ